MKIGILSRSILPGLALLFALGSPAEAAQPPVTVNQLTHRVDAYYNALHSLHADFTESYEGMGIHREEHGTLLLRKPGKMRWSYAQPPGKLFILNGKYGWFYSPGDAQAQRLPASRMNDFRSPLRFLLGHTKLEKEFENLSLSSSNGRLELSGVPKGMEKRIAEVMLGVTADGVIESIAIRETDGARTVFTFINSQPNVPAPETDFVFHPPPGIPVVDGLPPV